MVLILYLLELLEDIACRGVKFALDVMVGAFWDEHVTYRDKIFCLHLLSRSNANMLPA